MPPRLRLTCHRPMAIVYLPELNVASFGCSEIAVIDADATVNTAEEILKASPDVARFCATLATLPKSPS